MRAWVAGVLVVAIFTAGCVDDGGDPLDAGAGALTTDPSLPLLSWGEESAAGTAPLYLNATGPDDGARDVEILFPAGFWDTHEGHLAVVAGAIWGDEHTVSLLVETPPGAGPTTTYGPDPGSTTTYSSEGATLVHVAAPTSGTYRLKIETNGAAGYAAAIFVEARANDAPAEKLLPDLAALPPTDLALDGGQADSLPGGSQGCHVDEYAEDGARRCLRFSSSIANLGSGALEVRLSLADGALSVAGLGQFTQRVYASDGSYEDVPVGTAEFHGVHGHFHYEGVGGFAVHAVDETTGLRGDAVAIARKAGFCLIDVGIVAEPVPGAAGSSYSGLGCYMPDATLDAAWFMGVSPGWYDEYHSGLSDQYVDLSGVGDGVYDLVVTADAPDTLEEVTRENNEAATRFRLTGDEVEVLAYGA